MTSRASRAIAQSEAIDAGALGADDTARFWRDPRWHDLECLAARFVRHVYAPHVHDTYALGVILAGAEHYRYRGVEHVAGPGDLVILDPHELHDGRPAEGGYRYRMMYPAPSLMAEIAGEIADGPARAPHFPEAKLTDPGVAHAVARLHELLGRAPEKLQADGAFLETMALLIRRHGREAPADRPAGREDKAVARVREAIEDTLDEDWSMEALAALVGFSRYRLIRCFRRALGVTPHAYRTSRRVIRAKRSLASGATPAIAALEAGFYDQAHLTRVFKSVVGVTPAAFRRGCLT